MTWSKEMTYYYISTSSRRLNEWPQQTCWTNDASECADDDNNDEDCKALEKSRQLLYDHIIFQG